MVEAPHAMTSQKPKVFGIGFHKTGTSTLAAALRHLGYSVTGPNWVFEKDIAKTYVSKCRDLSKDFDAFQDNPWPLVYAEMDEMWPDAKFILTTRDVDKWVASQVKHFGRKDTPMRRLIYGAEYGCPAGNEERYAEVFKAHNAAVRSYFEGRELDFLEIDLTATSEWAPICTFLGVDVPAIPFPHANSAESVKRNSKLWRRVVRRMKRFSRRALPS